MLQVNVTPYNPEWPITAAKIRGDLENILTVQTQPPIPLIAIEHVGSTSVPDLAGKPLLDIDIIVLPEQLERVYHALTTHGYTYNPEPHIDRWSFRWNGHVHDQGASKPTEDGQPRRQCYVNIPGTKALYDHFAVRYIMRKDAALRQEYGQVKLELSTREYDTISNYGSGKNDVLKKAIRTFEALPENERLAVLSLDGKCPVPAERQKLPVRAAAQA